MINPVDDVEMLDNLMPNPLPVPQNPPMAIVQEEIGVNPPAPEAINIHLCSVCTTNVIDRFLNCELEGFRPSPKKENGGSFLDC
jgi:hypothetical protein